jgi:hypothetical protein
VCCLCINKTNKRKLRSGASRWGGIDANLFGPLKRRYASKKYILVITDAFTKYMELIDKEALTMTSTIFSWWVCRYGLPLELITN